MSPNPRPSMTPLSNRMETLAELLARSEAEAAERARHRDEMRVIVGGVVIEEACPYLTFFDDSEGNGAMYCSDTCDECHGRMTVLTDDGRRLIESLKFWLFRST